MPVKYQPIMNGIFCRFPEYAEDNQRPDLYRVLSSTYIVMGYSLLVGPHTLIDIKDFDETNTSNYLIRQM